MSNGITVGPSKVTIEKLVNWRETGEHYVIAFSGIQGVEDNATVSTVALTFSPASPLSDASHFLRSINDAQVSDFAMLPTGAKTPIHLSRFMLSLSSPFFANMFKGEWAETTGTSPKPFAWPIKAVLPCVLAMYSGWQAGDPVPNVVAVQDLIQAETGSKSFESHTTDEWTQVKELAQMLELKGFLWSVTKLLGQRYEQEAEELALQFFTDETPKEG